MREYKEVLNERLRIRKKCKEDKNFRKIVLEKCAKDTLFWFDNFAWTFDPRRDESEIPFIPYEGKQIQFLEFLENLLKTPRDAFIDKPRDVGATALMVNFLLKHWIFDDYFNARIGSRKEDYVDRTDDPDTLFYKIDYTLFRLPGWMLPEGWTAHSNRSYMRLSRPDNSNTIVGESANPHFARGGRQTLVFFDEIGFWPFAKSAWESAGDVTDIRIAMTTPPDTGKSSHAYKLYSGQAGELDVFGFDYSDIPSKDAEWLKKQRERRSAEEFEREVMKSYAGTTEGKVYAADWRLYVKETDCGYDTQLPLFVAWDFGLDTVAMIWIQKNMRTDQVKVIDSYSNANKQIDFYVPFITGEVISGAFDYTDEDLMLIKRHKDWKKDVTHYGDPNVINRNLTDKKSAFNVLRERGIYVNSKPWGNRKHRDLREKTKLLLRRTEINYERCAEFIEAMLSARYPKTRETAQPISPKDKPIHDWTSHFRSAFEYFADNEPFGEKAKRLKDIEKRSVYKPKGGYD